MNTERKNIPFLKTGTGMWLVHRLKTSGLSLFRKVGNSLERDQDLPLRILILKVWVYIKAMMSAPFYLKTCNRVGKRPRTRQRPYIENAGRIVIGDDVNINSKNIQTDLVTGPNGSIEIGNEVSINFAVSMVAEKQIKLGNRIRVGPYVMIQDSDRHVQGQRHVWANGEPVLIEDDVWLATRVIVLKGSHIGRGSIIASGSVVSGFIPPYSVAAGMPARVVKYLEMPDKSAGMNQRMESGLTDIDPKISRRTLEVFRKHSPRTADVDPAALFTFTSIEGWNSDMHMSFISALEAAFDITFQKEEMTRLSNLNKICRLIQNHQEKNVTVNELSGRY